MARYTGPKTKISRRYGVPLFGPSKSLERKNYPPGMHGPKGSRRKQSDYAIALGEKQKLRYQYGLLEKQFRRIFRDRAATSAASPVRRCSSFSRRGSTTSFSASASRTRAAPRASWFRTATCRSTAATSTSLPST